MKPYTRSNRVGGQIQKVLSEVLHKKIKDPRLKNTLITGVRMSSDLKSARIYFTASGDKSDAQQVTDGFQSALGYLKRVLAGTLGLRYMPNLTFHHDESFDRAEKIEKLLKQINIENETDHQHIETE